LARKTGYIHVRKIFGKRSTKQTGIPWVGLIGECLIGLLFSAAAVSPSWHFNFVGLRSTGASRG